MTMSVTEDGLDGDGADWLKERAASSQFILFGEQHDVAGLPLVVAAAYREFYEWGFHYLALENGPWLMDRLSVMDVEKGLAEWPYSLTFSSDDEVVLLRTVEDIFEAGGNRFWGLDQENNAIHPFQRIASVAAKGAVRRASRGLLLKAALQGGEYIRQDYSADLEKLKQLIGEDTHPEIRQLIDDVLISQEIFVGWRAGRQDAARRAASVGQREEYMMHRLDAELAKHQSHQTPPKVIFKMGGAHIIEGIGPNGVATLGNHAEKVAAANGFEAIQIGIRGL